VGAALRLPKTGAAATRYATDFESSENCARVARGTFCSTPLDRFLMNRVSSTRR